MSKTDGIYGSGRTCLRRAARVLALGLCQGLCFAAAEQTAAPEEETEPTTAIKVTASEEGEPAEAVQAANPYSSIVVRNAFSLKPLPPPVSTNEPAPQVNTSGLKLTGIITLLGRKCAMFVVQEPGKPELRSDLVREHEKDIAITNLEVVQIDERAGVVKVTYGGKDLALNFERDGLRAPVGPGAGAPGVPGAGAPGVIRAGGVSPQPPRFVGGNAPGTSPGGAGFTANVPTIQPASSAQAGMSGVQTGSGLRSIPMRAPRLSPGGVVGYPGGAGFSGNQPVAQQPEPMQTPEQQVMIMKAQTEAARSQGMEMPPMPPAPELMSSPGDGRMPPSDLQMPPMPGGPIPIRRY